ncbi:unnamed protein product [Chrysoparadoxa australica]
MRTSLWSFISWSPLSFFMNKDTDALAPQSNANPFSRFSYNPETSAQSISLKREEPEEGRAEEVREPNKKKTVKSAPTKKAKEMPAGGLAEKYCTPGEKELPLKVLIVGHNPSEKAWTSGHYYANPSNRMWALLRQAGLIPSHFTAEDDGLCPITSGIGFTDLGHNTPGTKSSEFKAKDLHQWRAGFYSRVTAHAARAAAAIGSEGLEAGAPQIVAFSGKRQWKGLFFDADRGLKTQANSCSYGLQSYRPPNWPLPASTMAFVLTSSSGAAAMTNTQREAPYLELGELVRSSQGLEGGAKEAPRQVEAKAEVPGGDELPKVKSEDDSRR